MSPRIVITGGPGSAKTEFLNRLQELSRFAEFVFLDELARLLLKEHPEYRQRTADFHMEIYRRQIAREAKLENRSFITDRGTVDAFAFHPETLRLVNTSLEAEYARYTSVIQLGTAAALGVEFYQSDDVRLEPVEDALAIERAIKNVWNKHPDYHFVPAREVLDSKFSQFLSTVDSCIKRTVDATEKWNNRL